MRSQLHVIHRLCGLFRWLCEPWPVWLATIGGLGAWLLGYVLSPTLEHQLRMAGAVLQVLGLCLVARGIRDMRRLFHQASYTNALLTWLRKLPDMVGAPKTVTGTASITLPGLKVSGEAYSQLVAPEGATLNERVALLEENLKGVHERISSAQTRVKAEIERCIGETEEERFARERGDEELKKILEEVAVGGVHLESVGLFWLLVGVVMGTVPDLVANVIEWLQGLF